MDVSEKVSHFVCFSLQDDPELSGTASRDACPTRAKARCSPLRRSGFVLLGRPLLNACDSLVSDTAADFWPMLTPGGGSRGDYVARLQAHKAGEADAMSHVAGY